MATNRYSFKYNAITGSTTPFRMLGVFAAGSSIPVKVGEILHLDTTWKPLNADEATTAATAIADEEVKAADRAGYYWIIVPRPGDVFEYELATAAATAVGASLYYSTSQKVTTSGSNVLGYAVGQDHYPSKQGHLTDDASPDSGSTIKSTSYIQMCIRASYSYWAALFA